MIKLVRHAAAAFAAIGVVSPAMAADVIPFEGAIKNQVSVLEGPGIFEFPVVTDFDADEAAWLAVPNALSTSTATSLFPAAGGFVGATQRFNADWSSPNSGTISVDFQALLVVPVGPRLTALNSFNANLNAWNYHFVAVEDGLITFDFSLFGNFTGSAPYDFKTIGILSIDGIGVLSDSGVNGMGRSATFKYNIDAGKEYFVRYFPSSFVDGISGNSVFNTSHRVSFSIGARPADPAVPEPATWAMMIAGFGLIGGAMRRRSALQAAIA